MGKRIKRPNYQAEANLEELVDYEFDDIEVGELDEQTFPENGVRKYNPGTDEYDEEMNG